MTTKDELESKHIAELHDLAAEAGIDRYRMLRREELIEKLAGAPSNGAVSQTDSAAGEEESEPAEAEPGGAKRRRRRRRPRRNEASSGESAGPRAKPEPGSGRDSGTKETQERLAGTVEVLPAGDALVRNGGREASLTAAQVKRCELRTGDTVEGPVQGAKRGSSSVAMARVEKVNGEDPESSRRPDFESLTPIAPARPIRLEIDREDVLTRAADILAPLAFGQRVLVGAEPRSGRTSVLRGIARAVSAGPDDVAVSALLVDERPEEITRWREEVPSAELHAASAEMHPSAQVRVAELALAQAKRKAEKGEDVLLIIDSLTRLAVAFGDPFEAKRFFGAGRDLAESGAGSVTVIAVALTTGETGAAVERAVETTENSYLELSAKLAGDGFVPALVVSRTSVPGEESLRPERELQAARKLRAELRLVPIDEAARTLADRIRATQDNAELLS